MSKELMKKMRAEFQHLMASERDVLLEQLRADHERLVQLQKDAIRDAQKE